MYSFTNAQVPSSNNSVGNEFEKLKGKLEWPVGNIKEIITYQQVLENTRKSYTSCTPPPYLIIKSDSSIIVKASAGGQVSRIFEIEGTWSVMIKCENYFLVYSNLNTVILKRGDTIQSNQPIGQINTPDDKNLFTLELMLLKATKYIDPYKWFKPMEKTKLIL